MKTAASSKTVIGGFTEESFEAFLKQRDEPGWLTDRRREAFARFQAFAWPSSATRNGGGPTSAP